MKIKDYSQQNFRRSLYLLFAVILIPRAGNLCAIANIPNLFSWLQRLALIFTLILLARALIRWALVTRYSHKIPFNLRLFK